MAGSKGGLTPEHVDSLDDDLIAAMPGGLVYVRADGSVAAANAEACRILGLRLEALSKRYVADFETETVREDGTPCPAEEYPVSRALATGKAQPGMTIGVRHPDGKIQWALFRATPVNDPSTGAILGAVVTFLDLTEHKRVEEELRGSRDQLRLAQQMAALGAWEWDVQTGVVRWSDENLAIHGLRRDEFDGTLEASTRAVHPDDRQRLEQSIGAAMSRGLAIPTEYRIIRPDGEVVDVLGWGQVVHRDGDRVLKLAGATQDVTRYQKLEAQLRKAQHMESVGLLAGGVAHDFNNLLQVILMSAEMGQGNPSRAGEALAEVRVAAERAAVLTRQLLSFSRQQPFHARALDVHNVIEELLRLVPRVLGRKVEVLHSVESGLLPVRADAGLLQQVLVNLCLNARDAMPGGGTLTVRAALAPAPDTMLSRDPEQESCVALEIVDTGCGMTTEVASRVFDPFFTTKPVGEGTGLGLAVVYGIVEQHGGRVEVESVPGRGSTFRVLLPIAREEDRREAEPRETAAHGSQERGRVLVAEDEELVRKMVVKTLGSAGYDVVEACDGAEALRHFGEDPSAFALVLTDVMMPVMGGLELAREVRELRPELPIVFTTGYAASQEPLDHEVVLGKPYPQAALLQTVAEALRHV